ncbi:MAG: hypothetical protein B7Z74_11185 [Deltaproteobacteria bacterium 21-66-5]|nr:MAG: hypothetical protein B7Z74_11185 [Deltaproteobacteria bacterium 21-66-5]
MTILWFVVWLLVNTFSSHQPLLFDPVNAWTATLILAIGLDLAAAQRRIGGPVDHLRGRCRDDQEGFGAVGDARDRGVETGEIRETGPPLQPRDAVRRRVNVAGRCGQKEEPAPETDTSRGFRRSQSDRRGRPVDAVDGYGDVVACHPRMVQPATLSLVAAKKWLFQ